MKNTMLILATSAVISTCGNLAANAQENPVVVIPGGWTVQQQQDQQTIGQGQPQQNVGQSPTMQHPEGKQDQQQTIGQGPLEENLGQAREGDDEDRADPQGYRGGGMMGWHGRGMMGREDGPGWMHRGWERRQGGGTGMMGGGIAPRIIFGLMDADGDGKLSLEEFRAAHDRLFKAMDTDKDGTVTMQEMMDFMSGTPRPPSQAQTPR